MGRRGRARGARGRLKAEDAEYVDPAGNVLVLRGALTAQTRRRYDAIARDQSMTVDDSWQRAVEFLFEQLAVRWVIADVPTESQRELLLRYRIASQDERRWVREAIREHVSTHFPELQAP